MPGAAKTNKREKKENQVRESHTCTPRCIWSHEAEVLSAAPCSTSLHVAGLAEETVVQRVAALLRGLDGQQHHAVLQRQGEGDIE